MYDTLLFLHFFGISIGAGTGIYLMALSRHATQNLDQAEARTLMPGMTRTISGVGTIGLLMLIASGLLMALMLGKGVLSGMFVTKMVLVGMLVLFVMVMQYLGGKLQQQGDKRIALRMKRISFLGPLLGGSIILIAVMAFH